MAVVADLQTPKESHKVTRPRLAYDVVERNESGLFDIHEDAIDAMEALHELRLPPDAAAEQWAIKHRAFMAMSAVARIAAPMETMNTNYLQMKTDTAATRDAIAKVDKAARERAERRKASK